jgi:uncharacterized protein YndB with AHSA1/START domain
VISNPHGSTHVEFPSEVEILLTREFEAPIELVFDVITQPEHVLHWFAPFEDKMKVSTIDLRDGGEYHMVFVTGGETECSFRGTFLEVDRPTRLAETWHFEGWPDVHAVETKDLREIDGVTTVTLSLLFRDKIGRDHMTSTDGFEDTFDKMEDYLSSLLHHRH